MNSTLKINLPTVAESVRAQRAAQGLSTPPPNAAELAHRLVAILNGGAR